MDCKTLGRVQMATEVALGVELTSGGATLRTSRSKASGCDKAGSVPSEAKGGEPGLGPID